MKILIVVPSYIEILSWNNQDFMECQPRLLLLTQCLKLWHIHSQVGPTTCQRFTMGHFFWPFKQKSRREMPIRKLLDSFRIISRGWWNMVRRSISRQISCIPLFIGSHFSKVDRIFPPMHPEIPKMIGTWCLVFLHSSRWWFQFFLFSPGKLGKWSNLTSIFFRWVETCWRLLSRCYTDAALGLIWKLLCESTYNLLWKAMKHHALIRPKEKANSSMKVYIYSSTKPRYPTSGLSFPCVFFWGFFQQAYDLCSFCTFSFKATSLKICKTWMVIAWWHRQFGSACAFHSPSLIRHLEQFDNGGCWCEVDHREQGRCWHGHRGTCRCLVQDRWQGASRAQGLGG